MIRNGPSSDSAAKPPTAAQQAAESPLLRTLVARFLLQEETLAEADRAAKPAPR